MIRLDKMSVDMRQNIAHIPRVTARVGPRILPATIVFLVVLIVGAIALILLLTNLPDQYAFWKSDEGLAMAEIIFALVAIFGLFPALLLWFSSGWVTVDASGMRWHIEGKRGAIRWDQPFIVRRWRSAMTIYDSSGDSVPYRWDYPLIVYEVAQWDTVITLHRGAALDEGKGLPFGERRGVMLFLHARRLMDAIDAASQA